MKHRTGILSVWGVLCILFLFLPVLVMVLYSFNSGRSLVIWEGFSVAPFVDALNNPAIRSAIGVSLLSATVSALISTVLGTSGGLALGRRPTRWGPWLVIALGLVMVTPDIVNAVSLLPWFVTLGVDLQIPAFNLGIVRLAISQSLFAAAVVTFIVRARVRGMDPSLEEAAGDLYAPPWRRFIDVTLITIRPAVISGALLAFTLSLNETVVASFVSVAGSTPWPVYVFASLKTGLRPELAAVSTIMLALTLIVLFVITRVLSRNSSGGGNAELVRTLTS